VPKVNQYRLKRENGIDEPLVFIVDDDDSMRNSIQRLVRSFGFRTASFSSARDFLNSPHDEDRACLLLDVRMPGMDGLDLQRLLSQSRNRLPIIFVTGHAKDVEKSRALRAGAVAFLHKPVSPEKLISAIKAALRRNWQDLSKAANGHVNQISSSN